jgi:hypothetical protein
MIGHRLRYAERGKWERERKIERERERGLKR